MNTCSHTHTGTHIDTQVKINLLKYYRLRLLTYGNGIMKSVDLSGTVKNHKANKCTERAALQGTGARIPRLCSQLDASQIKSKARNVRDLVTITSCQKWDRIPGPLISMSVLFPQRYVCKWSKISLTGQQIRSQLFPWHESATWHGVSLCLPASWLHVPW